jgi:integrase
MVLVDRHIDRLQEDGRAIRTIDSYRYDAGRLKKFISGIRVGEATPARLDAVIRTMKTSYGAITARRSRTILKGGLQLAVLAEILAHNPVRDIQTITSKKRPTGAPALTADGLRELEKKLRASDYCRKADLTDPVLVLIATGLRRSELLALRWKDFNPKAGTLTVAGKLVRKKGAGLVREDEAKSAAGLRTVALSPFAVEALKARRSLPFLGDRPMIFPSTAGGWRDPDNFGKQWRKARTDLGVEEVTSHSFRKTVATVLDDDGQSTRVVADHMGHAKISMTQDKYMSRGRVHTVVADVMERVINDE